MATKGLRAGCWGFSVPVSPLILTESSMKRNQLGEGTSFHLGSRRRRQAGCGYGMIWAIVIHCPVKPGRNDTKLQPLVPWWCSVRWSFRVTGIWESSRWRGLPGLGEGRGPTGGWEQKVPVDWTSWLGNYHSYGKIHHFQWENPLFRLGHFQ